MLLNTYVVNYIPAFRALLLLPPTLTLTLALALVNLPAFRCASSSVIIPPTNLVGSLNAGSFSLSTSTCERREGCEGCEGCEDRDGWVIFTIDQHLREDRRRLEPCTRKR